MLFRKKKKKPCIIWWTNIIQYDCMGSPLRLVKLSNGKYQLRDTYEKDNDKALIPEEVLKLNLELFD